MRRRAWALAKAIAAVHWTSYHDAVVQYDKVIANQVSNAYVMQLKAHAMLRADKPIFAEACARQALKFDEKYLRAHLTLARSDGVAAGARTAEGLIAAAADLRVRWTVDRIVLFESVTGGGPARYIPLEEARLVSS